MIGKRTLNFLQETVENKILLQTKEKKLITSFRIFLKQKVEQLHDIRNFNTLLHERQTNMLN